jgi:hypothetical protein
MPAKLRIDLLQGIVEVEGTEELVVRVYDDFKEHLSQTGVQRKPAAKVNMPAAQTNQSDGKDSKRKPRGTRKEAHSVVGDLDLSNKGGKQSLKEFHAEHTAKSNMDCNLLFVYYLKNVAKLGSISTAHVYTCYKQLQMRVPNALEQSLIDTKRKKSWLETSDLTNITLTTLGENHVEHDMKKAEPTDA